MAKHIRHRRDHIFLRPLLGDFQRCHNIGQAVFLIGDIRSLGGHIREIRIDCAGFTQTGQHGLGGDLIRLVHDQTLDFMDRTFCVLGRSNRGQTLEAVKGARLIQRAIRRIAENILTCGGAASDEFAGRFLLLGQTTLGRHLLGELPAIDIHHIKHDHAIRIRCLGIIACALLDHDTVISGFGGGRPCHLITDNGCFIDRGLRIVRL